MKIINDYFSISSHCWEFLIQSKTLLLYWRSLPVCSLILFFRHRIPERPAPKQTLLRPIQPMPTFVSEPPTYDEHVMLCKLEPMDVQPNGTFTFITQQSLFDDLTTEGELFYFSSNIVFHDLF